ncbi:hypothetical protein BRADI_3g18586v3 [Brachypodium distachyon]|uniref:Uncharacterized protein n=1 Tax=Brachypodium distachyon TaxID=15368 RepID=A0A2K2CY20_BRADI|nr:hypothetical protein BRADI_3g18586v3 [Brachypodium distachyon]
MRRVSFVSVSPKSLRWCAGDMCLAFTPRSRANRSSSLHQPHACTASVTQIAKKTFRYI